MDCGGGIADVVNRTCVNCIDLPYRTKREALSGERIAYTTTETDEGKS